MVIEESLHFSFKMSNNQVMYETIIGSFTLSKEVGGTKVDMYYRFQVGFSSLHRRISGEGCFVVAILPHSESAPMGYSALLDTCRPSRMICSRPTPTNRDETITIQNN